MEGMNDTTRMAGKEEISKHGMHGKHRKRGVFEGRGEEAAHPTQVSSRDKLESIIILMVISFNNRM